MKFQFNPSKLKSKTKKLIKLFSKKGSKVENHFKTSRNDFLSKHREYGDQMFHAANPVKSFVIEGESLFKK